MSAAKVLYVPNLRARPEPALLAALVETRGTPQALILRRAFGCAQTQHMVDPFDLLELPARLSGVLHCLIAPASGLA